MELEDSGEAVHLHGHRRFVGGNDEFWEKVGEWQFRLLLDRGLTESDTFIDVACGSLRGGARFIRYLQPGRYLGLDKFIELIIYGVALELGIETYRAKMPRFVVSGDFEFHKFSERPNFGLVQSLFTHLAPRDVELCLTRLRAIAAPGCRLVATFYERPTPIPNTGVSNSHGYFGYTRAQMEEFGVSSGWTPTYIGECGHPRQQRVIEYRA